MHITPSASQHRGHRAPATAHRCPGHCGRQVPDRYLACPECWRALPGPLRRRVCSTAHLHGLDQARTDALAAATTWWHAQVIV